MNFRSHIQSQATDKKYVFIFIRIYYVLRFLNEHMKSNFNVQVETSLYERWLSASMLTSKLLVLKVSLFHNEMLMTKIFQNCNEKIIRISAQKFKKLVKPKK